MKVAGMTLSVSAVLALAALIVGVVGAVVVGYRARRRQARMRVLARDHESWDYLERTVNSWEWEPSAAQAYLRYFGRMSRLGAFGRGVTHWRVYRVNRRAIARRDARTVQSGWFHTVMHFIPRQIRSPWFDHLLEDRERMAMEGRSHRFIAWATAVQCMSLVAHLLWERAWDLLTPFKPRSH